MDAAKNKSVTPTPLDLFSTTSGASAKKEIPEFANWLYSREKHRTSNTGGNERTSHTREHSFESSPRTEARHPIDDKPTSGDTCPQKFKVNSNGKSRDRNAVSKSDRPATYHDNHSEIQESSSDSETSQEPISNTDTTSINEEKANTTQDEFATSDLIAISTAAPITVPPPELAIEASDAHSISPEVQQYQCVLPAVLNVNLQPNATESTEISLATASQIEPTNNVENVFSDGLETIVDLPTTPVVDAVLQQPSHLQSHATIDAPVSLEQSKPQAQISEHTIAESAETVSKTVTAETPVATDQTQLLQKESSSSESKTEVVADSVENPTYVGDYAELQPLEDKDASSSENHTHEEEVVDAEIVPVVENAEQHLAEQILSTDKSPREQQPTSASEHHNSASRTDAVHVTSAEMRGSRPWLHHALGKESPASTETREIDISRFTNRIAKAFHMAQQREGEIKMRLHPPELGSLRIELQLQDGQLHARLQTETSEARTLIMDNLPILKERLAEQNIRVERFDVDLFDPTGQQPQQSGSEFSRENQPKATRQKTHNSSPAIREELPTSSQNSQHLNAKNINVII